ncbi:MAG: molecular chaperone GrpE [Solirubrobacterales bacterium]|nr:molecular chaperone GrpE [Solirubrobacterales bacterium]
MSDENDARARDSATRDEKVDEEVVDAEVVDDPRAPASEETDGNDAADQVERDLDELAETKRERDEYLELAQRTRADFDNYRKRVARETSEALARGKAELARELLPVIDNLERALNVGEDASAHEALARGVAMVHDELRGRLENAGVEAFDPIGERFDPQLHEALSTRPEEGTEPGMVVETLEKGYRLNGQVLRPARVVVSK